MQKHQLLILLGTIGALINTSHAAAPANDAFANAQIIAGPNGAVAGTNVEATTESSEVVYGFNSIWYKWTAPTSGLVYFDTFGSDFDTKLLAGTGSSVSAFSTLASNDDTGDLAESQIGFNAVAGNSYYIRVSSYSSGDTNPTVLNWALAIPPANDNFADATALTGAAGTATQSTRFATREVAEVNAGESPSVWFTWTAPFTGTVQFDSFGSNFDTYLELGTGTSPETFSVLASNDDSLATPVGEASSRVRVSVTSGVTYQIRVQNFDNGGNLVLNWGQINFTPAVIGFTNASYSISEDLPKITLQFTRTLGSANEPVDAFFYTSGLSAGVNDYDDVARTISFAVGATTASVDVFINPDTLIEGVETVELVLSDPSEGAIVNIPNARLAIVDDEGIIPLKAAYSGLVNLWAFDNALSGALDLKTDGKNGFSGSLSIAGVKYPIKGAFDTHGVASVPIARKNGLPTLTLTLSYAAAGAAFRGTLTDGVLVDGQPRLAEFELASNPFSAAHPYHNGDATFTVRIPAGASVATDVPKGDGFLSVTVSKLGLVKVTGCLADGTPITAGGPIDRNLMSSCYVPLYKGLGSFSTVLNLSPDSDGSGSTNWFKPAISTDTAFKSGFNFSETAEVYTYARYPRTAILPSLFFSNNVLIFSAADGGLAPNGLTQASVLSEDLKLNLPLAPGVKLTLSVTGKTGTFAGTFAVGSEKPTAFKGAFFQSGDFGSGYFLRSNNGTVSSGGVNLYAQ